MSRPKSSIYYSLCFIAICIIATISFSACSGGSAQQSGIPDAPASGGVSFRLVWQQPLSGAKALFAPPLNACVDHGINTITATVSNGTSTVTNSWPCSTHEGFISGVPAGTNYTVQVNGLSSGPTTTLWSGLATPITVTAGLPTDAGTIALSYIGGDTTQPTVNSINPYTWNFGNGGTTVPVTDRFIVSFNKPMAISTITTANITLKLYDNTPVPGTVSYDGASNTAAIIPSATLAYDTQFVLQVTSCVTTSCITDTAGNPLSATYYTNAFRTETAPVVVSDAPLSVAATPGNGQIRLDWLAANGATSYNVYYGLSSGTTIMNGTKIPDARAPFVHIGLNNSTPYYYIVTAVNSYGESLASTEVSATPLFPVGDSLPPVSLTVTPLGGQNSITWPAVSGATAYNLYWSNSIITPDKYSADNVIRDVTSPYIHSTTSPIDCYIATAVNFSGESADSMQVCVGNGTVQIIW